MLVHAAAGGLGLMAVQIARAVGARVIATASTKEKLDVARRFGADECVDYNKNKYWWKEVLELTEGQGVDVVYDPVGLVDKSLKCLKHKGRVLLVGFAGIEGNMEKIAMNRVLLKQAQLIGYVSGLKALSMTLVLIYAALRRNREKRSRRECEDLERVASDVGERPSQACCF